MSLEATRVLGGVDTISVPPCQEFQTHGAVAASPPHGVEECGAHGIWGDTLLRPATREVILWLESGFPPS